MTNSHHLITAGAGQQWLTRAHTRWRQSEPVPRPFLAVAPRRTIRAGPDIFALQDDGIFATTWRISSLAHSSSQEGSLDPAKSSCLGVVDWQKTYNYHSVAPTWETLMVLEPGKITYVTAAVGILAGLLVLYSVLIAQQLLGGLFAALLVILVYLAWRYLRTFDLIPKNNGYMTAVVTVLAGLVFLYGLLIAQQFLLGTLTALLLILTYFAWQYLRKIERRTANNR